MLDQLHRELVAGVVSPVGSGAIVEWSEIVRRSDDPALAAILSDIELRVRVELAKLDLQACSGTDHSLHGFSGLFQFQIRTQLHTRIFGTLGERHWFRVRKRDAVLP